jgi:hypothetical protein
MSPEKAFYERRNRTKQTERQPKIVVDLMKLDTLMIELVSSAGE